MSDRALDVTLVTPSLNQGEFIEQTIKSVLAQDGVALQYILVDGGSTDDTHRVLDRYADRFDTLLIEPDEGQADALAKGFRLARGEICGYLNSDDYLLPGALARVVRLFERYPDVDVIYGDRIYVDAQDRVVKYWRLPLHVDYLMGRWDFIPQEACFWRRSAMERVGGIDPSYQFAVDYDLFARMMAARVRFKHVAAFFAVFREHADSKTSARLEDVGLAEMERVRERYGFGIRKPDWLLGALFYGLLVGRSALFRWRYPAGPSVFARRETG